MLPVLEKTFAELELARRGLAEDFKGYSDEQLRWRPSPDRWSLIMALQHIVTAEKAILQSAEELGQNPVRSRLQPGKMIDVVMEVLEKDIPVEVPHPSLEPNNRGDREELMSAWEKSRHALRDFLETVSEQNVHEVMFSHPAAGPLDPIRTLQLAKAHYGTHRRQIDRLISDMPLFFPRTSGG